MLRSTIGLRQIHPGKLLPIKPKFRNGLELEKGMVTRLSSPSFPEFLLI